jgi:hypothetical protein
MRHYDAGPRRARPHVTRSRSCATRSLETQRRATTPSIKIGETNATPRRVQLSRRLRPVESSVWQLSRIPKFGSSHHRRFCKYCISASLGYVRGAPLTKIDLVIYGRSNQGNTVGKALRRLVTNQKMQFRWRNAERNSYIFRDELRKTVSSRHHDVAAALGQA